MYVLPPTIDGQQDLTVRVRVLPEMAYVNWYCPSRLMLLIVLPALIFSLNVIVITFETGASTAPFAGFVLTTTGTVVSRLAKLALIVWFAVTLLNV